MITITWSIESTHRSPFGGDRIEVGTGELKIDGFFSHSFDYGLDVSTAPIERSQDITDHARPKIKMHKFQCFVSDDPYNPELKQDDHSEAVLGGLDYLVKNAIPIDLETDRAFLEGYLIIHRSGLRDETTGDGAEFTLTIQEVAFGEIETVDAPSPSVERARPRRNGGNQPGSSTGSDETGSRDPSQRQDTVSRLRDVQRNSGAITGAALQRWNRLIGQSEGA